MFAALASLGLGLLSRHDQKKANKANVANQDRVNNENRDWDLAMYRRQRGDAASDWMRNRAATLDDYERQRADALGDYERQRADASGDYERQRGDQLSDISEQFVRLREAAQKGGFNPLTGLGGQSMPTASLVAPSLLTPQLQTPGLASPSATVTPGHAAYINPPPLASYSMMLEGFQGVGDVLSGQLALDRAEQVARTRLMQIEAERMLAAVPVSGPPGTGAVRLKSLPSGQPNIEQRTSVVTNPFPRRPDGAFVDPSVPDAEDTEARYGDIAQEVAGGLNVVQDFLYNRALNNVAKDHGADARIRVHEAYVADPSQDFGLLVQDITGEPVRYFMPRLWSWPGDESLPVNHWQNRWRPKTLQ